MNGIATGFGGSSAVTNSGTESLVTGCAELVKKLGTLVAAGSGAGVVTAGRAGEVENEKGAGVATGVTAGGVGANETFFSKKFGCVAGVVFCAGA